jgi:HNH endonuclease
MTESSEWQRVGDVPVDTGRLVLVDPMNIGDVLDHEDEVTDHEVPGSMTNELTNDYGSAVALVFSTGLGDALYPVEARFELAERSRSDRRGTGPVPTSPGDRLRGAPMSPVRKRACVCGAVDCQRHGRSGGAKRRSFGRGYTRSGWATNPPPANRYAYSGNWARIRLQVLERDGYGCQLRYAVCVGRASQVDHIVQPEAGGSNDLANLRSVCVRCHRRRSGRQGALAKQQKQRRRNPP